MSTGIGSTAVTAFGVLLTQLTSFGFNSTSIEALSGSGSGGVVGPTAANQPRLKASADLDGSSADDARERTVAALLALLESLGSGLTEGRARLETLLGPEWEDSLGAAVDTLRPGWKVARGLVGYVVAQLPASRPGARVALRKVMPRPRPAAGAPSPPPPRRTDCRSRRSRPGPSRRYGRG